MNKTELITVVAQKTELSKKEAEKAVKAVFETVADELAKGEKVQVIGFGTFEVRDRAAREGRNPLTNEVIKIAASKSPAFKAGKQLKELVNATKATKVKPRKK
ncbi:MAG: HU family DNA-binding protein [Veillonella sp.]|uniref:HU family DNA-binding protein n=1 Tax=Veillonella sp. TaxID=1926307 RepID=UPI0025DA8838|nr:HU family DNA-binding protein [Veillonella sp.]MBS4913912.1 HU family DNA-binding protein [Veillonella sp.]